MDMVRPLECVSRYIRQFTVHMAREGREKKKMGQMSTCWKYILNFYQSAIKRAWPSSTNQLTRNHVILAHDDVVFTSYLKTHDEWMDLK